MLVGYKSNHHPAAMMQLAVNIISLSYWKVNLSFAA
jgi:hypothetical protein